MSQFGRLSISCLLMCIIGTGCLFVAPIDEEPVDDDVPPRIVLTGDNLSPQLGNRLKINLDRVLPIQPFIVRTIDDPNADQTLYWRVAVEHLGAVVVVTGNTSISPEERRNVPVIRFNYTPCEDAYKLLRVPEDANHLLYLGVADAPFSNPGPIFTGDLATQRLARAFETTPPSDPDEPARDPAIVVWGIELEGECE